jgi:glycosyltransferase involved in cell wall biosynthesis
MNILQVIDTLNRGGAERVLVDLSNLLANRGHAVTVLTLLEPGPLEAELTSDVKRISLHRKNKYSLTKAIEFMDIVNQFDIVHIHMRHVLAYFLYASIFSKIKSKIVFHDHWGDIDFDRRVPFAIRLLKKKITYFGVSAKLSDWAIKVAGLPASRVFLLPNIVRINVVPTASQRNGKLMMIANFRRTKNIEFGIDVLREIRKHRDLKLDVYGRDQDLQYLAELKNHVVKQGLEQAISFQVNENDVRTKIPQYEMAIHTAKSETGPLVLIEYLALKKPFLSFHTGEVADQLADKFPEFFMKNFDARQWAAQILQIFDGQVSYALDAFEDSFNKFFSEDQYVSACENMYSKILNEDAKA